MEPLAYSIKELSKATGISRSKLYEQIKAGKLRATKVGNRTIILQEHVQEWLKLAENTEKYLLA